MLPEDEFFTEIDGIDSDYYYDEDECPVCGCRFLVKEGHCTYCYECGWSRCDL